MIRKTCRQVSFLLVTFVEKALCCFAALKGDEVKWKNKKERTRAQAEVLKILN